MKRKGKGSRPWLLPFIAMPVLTVALSLLAAKLILSGVIPEDGMLWCATVTVGIVSFLLCICSSFSAARKRFLWGMATALTYACLLLMANLLFFGEGYGGNIPAICGAVTLGGISGSMLGGGLHRKNA